MIILGTNSIKDTGYDVANSLRFNSGSSDYLNVTQSSGTSDIKGTFSVWLKGTLGGGSKAVFSGHTDSNNRIALYFSDSLRIYGAISGSQSVYLITTQLFRDPNAWYHIVVAWDTSQGTDTNRFKVYVNGSQITSFSTASYPSQNADVLWSKGTNLTVGARFVSSISSHYDGYMAETVFIDGQQLDPTSFGEFDSDSNIWKPIDVSGLTFGNNGFYLDFKDSSALGNDANGSNNFTVNNLTALDQSIDTCTNNFSTLNLLIYESRDNTFAEGNLKITGGGGNDWVNHYGVSNFAVSSGKWFVEAKITTAVGSQGILGIMGTSTALGGSLRDFGPANIDAGGRISGGGGDHQTGLTNFANGDIAGAAFDATNGTIQFYRNGSAYGNAVSSIASDTYYFVTNSYEAGAVVEFNFGSPPYSESGGNSDGDGYGNFSMAVPSGYFALNTKNLAEYG